MAADNTNDYISPVSGQAFEQAFHTRDDLSLEEQIELGVVAKVRRGVEAQRRFGRRG